MKFRCIKEFKLPVYDVYENTTEDYHTIHIGSVYEYEPDYIGQGDIRMYLENGDDAFGYIDITHKMLDEFFARIE